MTDRPRARPPRWFKAMNKVVMQTLRLGMTFAGEHPVVLTVPGRRSGKPRSTPVTPVTVEGRKYIVSGFPGSDWVANVRAAGEAKVARGGRSQRVRLVELPLDEARPVLRAFPSQVPVGVRFMKRLGMIEGGSPEEFETHPELYAVFRLE